MKSFAKTKILLADKREITVDLSLDYFRAPDREDVFLIVLMGSPSSC
jgi:hypothetical protein